MKKFFFNGISLLVLTLNVFISCDNSDEDSVNYLYTVPEEMAFTTISTVEFRFVDGQGNDLIDINDMSTYPFIRNTIISPDSVDKVLQNMDGYPSSYDGCRMSLNKTENGIVVSPFLYGDNKGVTNNYVYINGEFDTIQAHWVYTTEDVVGAKYYAELVYMTYNGKVIKKVNGLLRPVLTIVKDNGKTSIK